MVGELGQQAVQVGGVWVAVGAPVHLRLLVDLVPGDRVLFARGGRLPHGEHQPPVPGRRQQCQGLPALVVVWQVAAAGEAPGSVGPPGVGVLRALPWSRQGHEVSPEKVSKSARPVTVKSR